MLHKFEHEQVRFVSEGTFMLEDDDEEVRYPAFDGKLYEPFLREEISYLTPALYQLNWSFVLTDKWTALSRIFADRAVSYLMD